MKQLSELKIFFMGTPQIAQNILRHLVENEVPIHTVVTQPDRPYGRKKTLRPSEVKVYAQQQGIPVAQFEKIDAAAMDFFQKERPALILVAAYGIILPKALVSLPEFGCINVHMSLLPALRGPSPIQTSLMRGFKSTGTTIMLMDEKMDTGDILAQQSVPIEDIDNYDTLEQKLVQQSAGLLIPTLSKWINGHILPAKQDSSKATYTKMIKKEDGHILWDRPAADIYHQYQALFRWPKIFTFWPTPQNDSPLSSNDQTGKKITLLEIDYQPDSQQLPYAIGQVYKTHDSQIAVNTGKGSVILKAIQLEGKNPAQINNFLNGYPNFIGARLN